MSKTTGRVKGCENPESLTLQLKNLLNHKHGTPSLRIEPVWGAGRAKQDLGNRDLEGVLFCDRMKGFRLRGLSQPAALLSGL